MKWSVNTKGEYRVTMSREEMRFINTIFFAGSALIDPDQYVMSLGQRAIQMQTANIGEEHAQQITREMEIISNDLYRVATTNAGQSAS